jgi:hypothetical protein
MPTSFPRSLVSLKVDSRRDRSEPLDRHPPSAAYEQRPLPGALVSWGRPAPASRDGTSTRCAPARLRNSPPDCCRMRPGGMRLGVPGSPLESVGDGRCGRYGQTVPAGRQEIQGEQAGGQGRQAPPPGRWVCCGGQWAMGDRPCRLEPGGCRRRYSAHTPSAASVPLPKATSPGMIQRLARWAAAGVAG